MKAKRNYIFMLGILLLLGGGCKVKSPYFGRCEDSYPELPNNDFCLKKIAEHREYMNDRSNAKNVTFTKKDGTKYAANVTYSPYSIDAYLGILQGRAAIEKYSVVITPEQSKKFATEKLPDFWLEITGSGERIGVQDYFSHRNDMHLRIVTFYYLKDNREKFQQWLRKKLPVEELPRLKSAKLQKVR